MKGALFGKKCLAGRLRHMTVGVGGKKRHRPTEDCFPHFDSFMWRTSSPITTLHRPGHPARAVRFGRLHAQTPRDPLVVMRCRPSGLKVALVRSCCPPLSVNRSAPVVPSQSRRVRSALSSRTRSRSRLMATLGGCYSEGLNIVDLRGKVVVVNRAAQPIGLNAGGDAVASNHPARQHAQTPALFDFAKRRQGIELARAGDAK